MTFGNDPVFEPPGFCDSYSRALLGGQADGTLERSRTVGGSSPGFEAIDQPARRQDADLSRLLDILGASLILLVVLPFLCLLAIAIKCDSRGPLFFAQRRIGRDGREFSCFKFRTMCVDADAELQRLLSASAALRFEWAQDQKLRHDPRVTRLGRLIRRLSLDEFPQLINIIRGDMSLVGPRPIVAAEITRYGRYITDYCAVRPGLTGLWQVSGRNDVSYRRRVSMDRIYVRNKSVWFDLVILFRTVPVVLGSKGSY